MAQQTYYEILGVIETASLEDIRKSYRRKAFEWHPDKVLHLPPAAQDAARKSMMVLNEAYAVLEDPARRKEYDQFLLVVKQKKVQKDGAAPAARPDPAPARPPEPGGVGRREAAAAPRPSSGPAGPEPQSTPSPVEPKVSPPPEPGADELARMLEAILGRIKKEISEAVDGTKWKVARIPGFDLALEGGKGTERYGVYVGTLEKLDVKTLDDQRAALVAACPPGQFALLKRYTAMLLLCLGLPDPGGLRSHVRELNLAALASVPKKRGETAMVGFLHVTTGELWFPFMRTIRPDLRPLRSIALGD